LTKYVMKKNNSTRVNRTVWTILFYYRCSGSLQGKIESSGNKK
jgi:hypothetical protein